MERYEVYLYNIPKLTPDGKGNLPIEASKRHEFANAAEAKTFAAEHKTRYDRVVVIHVTDAEQKLLERYGDGLLGHPPPERAPAPTPG
jgi:hypothetical protein